MLRHGAHLKGFSQSNLLRTSLRLVNWVIAIVSPPIGIVAQQQYVAGSTTASFARNSEIVQEKDRWPQLKDRLVILTQAGGDCVARRRQRTPWLARHKQALTASRGFADHGTGKLKDLSSARIHTSTSLVLRLFSASEASGIGEYGLTSTETATELEWLGALARTMW